ncbi:MAG: peptide chain release factor N(5)-glutamine methyltransferase [Candidatus Kerfeldbacteria bacterium CG08_land_8_20_14_0_20_43_14]|uniref:Peptide chain release factor N(5)-glutamine methyltransferase n=1 Tax=Candidatus Kerfeldbacteria bacterium CG08_land_8_20_14_0_20_43_14 TaxID=2014246 RepID=A0A2H0YQ07_9BACT|nr:MAG: peptide chain release factor N(5)-glutamine methyltransferase [Candidatus Kerfeldbacteria bacterium CG08_land_8_20_14_0_20_43_14]
MPPKKLSIQEILLKAQKLINNTPINLNEARDIFEFVSNKPKSFLVAYPDHKIDSEKTKLFFSLLKQRIKGVPFAHLIGQKGFYGLDFKIDNNVLIPRPETEQMIDWILKKFPRDARMTIADIGTGSGCIAVTLAKYFPKAEIIAVDISKKALTMAGHNARLHGVSQKIKFIQGSLLYPLNKFARIDLIAGNLPYLTKPELLRVPFEPKIALDGGEQGLELIYELIDQIIERQIPRAILEISPLQEPWLETKMRDYKNYKFEFQKDLSGKIRFLVLEN